MKFVTALAFILAACGGVHPTMPDAASPDSASDAGAASPCVVGSTLPTVPKGAKDCADNAVHDGHVCVSEGWFLLSRWTTARYEYDGNGSPDSGSPVVCGVQAPMYLDAFVIDEHEISNTDYLAFVQATSAPPPPDKCGWQTPNIDMEKMPNIVDEISGWGSGKPFASLQDRPVVCVTRSEAAAYCKWKGGRLPTAGEWMKSGRGPYPDVRRFPWGDQPPDDAPQPWGAFDWRPYMAVELSTSVNGGELMIARVTTAMSGRSPRNVLGLAGNASEWLSTCGENLESIYGNAGDNTPRVRPDDPPSPMCSTASLFAGSNWRSMPGADAGQALGALTIFRTTDNGFTGDYVGTLPSAWQGTTGGAWFWLKQVWPTSNGPQDAAGNVRRDWTIGFRCAYDL